MVAAFYAAGGASPEFTDALHEAAGVVQGEFGSSTSFAATSVEQLATALQGARGALADYDNAQLAQIAGTVANESAIDDLASKYGVSSDFISQKLGELGVNAFGMSDQTEQAFAQAAFGVDKNGNLIEAKSAEMSEAVTEAMSDLKEAITGAVNPFEKLAKDGSKSFDKYMDQHFGKGLISSSAQTPYRCLAISITRCLRVGPGRRLTHMLVLRALGLTGSPYRRDSQLGKYFPASMLWGLRSKLPSLSSHRTTPQKLPTRSPSAQLYMRNVPSQLLRKAGIRSRAKTLRWMCGSSSPPPHLRPYISRRMVPITTRS